MKTGYLYLQNKSWRKHEKAAAIFGLKLLILLSLLKISFFAYNRALLTGTSSFDDPSFWIMAKWSVLYDLFTIALINTPFLLLLCIISIFTSRRLPEQLVSAFFLLLNFLCLALNVLDIFYVHFHRQRADADLLYVLQHPVQKLFTVNWMSGLLILSGTMLLFWVAWKAHRTLLKSPVEKGRFMFSSLAGILFLVVFFVSGPKKALPTYPLTVMNSSSLQYVQNSFHTFLYSVYRNKEGIVRPYAFLPASELITASISKKGCSSIDSARKKNIVLFIMESIPEDFFNDTSRYKVAMPFMESLVGKSKYFSRAYSYSFSSNKGIVAILSGIPTLTEIPLYHSNYASMKMTHIGASLSQQGYTSSFFIGDDYDDFGFAKCCNWLGIQQYYCKENIPGYQQMESHTMGLHDQYVLKFMGDELNAMKEPFFAAQYNVSTHYPNDLPKNYHEKYPAKNFSDPMRSMSYYNECMSAFFNRASKEAWYNNTVFIFCADHWMNPDFKDQRMDLVQRFHIPLFIFDPSDPKPEKFPGMVSQLDVMNTVLCLAGQTDSMISYGENLLGTGKNNNRLVFSRENASLYQATDSNYVLGFNAVTGKAEYCYHYKTDPQYRNNLILSPSPVTDSMIKKMKLFLQTASYQYNKLGGF